MQWDTIWMDANLCKSLCKSMQMHRGYRI
jgi:hypothetical protein